MTAPEPPPDPDDRATFRLADEERVEAASVAEEATA